MLRAIIFLVALSAGGASVWLSRGAFVTLPGAGDSQVAAPTENMTEILVAATDLEPGALIDPIATRWQSWPQEALNPAFITRELRPDAAESLAGLIVRTGLIAGEPIHDAKLTSRDAGALSVILASGKRAVAVRISAENSAGGFILPNDRVDVLLTTNSNDMSGNKSVRSKVILKNVKVLAVDQMIDNSTEAVVGKTATLELKPAEAEIVTAAEVLGAVSLALRAVSDNGEDTAVLVAAKQSLRIFRNGQMETIEFD